VTGRCSLPRGPHGCRNVKTAWRCAPLPCLGLWTLWIPLLAGAADTGPPVPGCGHRRHLPARSRCHRRRGAELRRQRLRGGAMEGSTPGGPQSTGAPDAAAGRARAPVVLSPPAGRCRLRSVISDHWPRCTRKVPVNTPSRASRMSPASRSALPPASMPMLNMPLRSITDHCPECGERRAASGEQGVGRPARNGHGIVKQLLDGSCVLSHPPGRTFHRR